MKLLFFFIFFSYKLFAFDSFEEATIIFNDGHTETGLISSFLESNRTSNKNTLESQLNLDDKSFEFKINKDGIIRIVNTDDVKSVTIKDFKGNDIVYEVVSLKELDKKGKITDQTAKVYLQLVKAGKITVYVTNYTQKEVKIGRDNYITHYYLGGKELMFYYQNKKVNYAINYNNVGPASMFCLKERMMNPLRELFADCPSALLVLEKEINPSNIDKKAAKLEDKRLSKEFKALSEDQRKDFKTLHFYECNSLDLLIDKYEKCN
jgi:hypothetical protein